MISATLNKLSNWFLHHRQLAGYFEPVIQQILPANRYGMFRAQVSKIQQQDRFVHLTLTPSNSWLLGRWKVHKAGQHIELTIEVNGRLLTRIFTISSSPETFIQHNTITVSIKQNEQGRFTPLLTEALKTSCWVNISEAKGEFVYQSTDNHDNTPIIMVAGGSGITPIMSMLSEHLSTIPNPVYLRYLASAGEHQFTEALTELALDNPQFSVDLFTRTQHIDNPLTIPDQAMVYCCGPQALMSDIQKLADASGAKYFQENFGLAVLTDTAMLNDEKQLNISINGQSYLASNQQNLLVQLETQTDAVIRGCGIGVCHQCQCKKTSGLVKNLLTGDVSDSGEQLIQLCISQPLSDLEVTI